MLLSDRDIRAEVKADRVRVEPFDEAMIQPSSVDVRLDKFFRVFENHKYSVIDPSIEQGELTREYVVATRSAGAGVLRLMLLVVLPNCAAPLIVQATLGFSAAILDAAALGFLGLGAQPPTPEWGTMLADALQFYQRAWWLLAFPGIAILVTVMAFNLLGDGLRDALDPKLRR